MIDNNEDKKELDRMEKDFGYDIATKMFMLGYRKTPARPRCERCGVALSFDPAVTPTAIRLLDNSYYAAKLCGDCSSEYLKTMLEKSDEFYKSLRFKKKGESE